MAYVDGFIGPLPKKNIDAYKEISGTCGAIWREHGALQYRECIAKAVKRGKRHHDAPNASSIVCTLPIKEAS